MNDIGIYCRAFPRLSEAFIREQAANLKRYRPTFVTNSLVKPNPFSCVSISESDIFSVKQNLFLLTRRAGLFGNPEAFKKLSLLHAHFGVDGVYAMAIAQRIGIPFVVTFHGYDITISRQAVWKSGRWLYYQLLLHEAELQQQAAGFIAVSRYIQNQLIEKGYAPEKIVQHYIGVDTQKFVPDRRRQKERYILCVGRHTEKKGIDTLLRGFARIASKHPDVQLFQIGTGTLARQLRALARELNIEDRVRFLGAKPHEEVLELLQGAEVFALASQRATDGDCEGLPIVILEAAACEIPVVSTWHSGIPEAVLDGETGFLVPEGDDRALAEKLDVLLSDRALGQAMGHQGRELIGECFDIYKQSSKLEAIYDCVLQRSRVLV